MTTTANSAPSAPGTAAAEFQFDGINPFDQVNASSSEISELDSERTKGIIAFTDDNLLIVKTKDLGSKYQSRDPDTLVLEPEHLNILPGLNPRIESAEWKNYIENTLVPSMQEHGFMPHKPIYAFALRSGGKKTIYVADGESRLRAVMIAKARGLDIPFVTVKMAPEGTSVEDIMMQLAPSNVSREFTALEKSIHAQRLIRLGKSKETIAENFGCSCQYVDLLLTLASAPRKIRDLVNEGSVPAGMAIDALRSADPEKAVADIQETVEKAAKVGQSRITAKHLPDAGIKRAYTKLAPSMHSILNDIQKSDSFILLPDDIKERMETLILDFEKSSKPKEPKAPKPASLGFPKNARGRKSKKSKPVEESTDSQPESSQDAEFVESFVDRSESQETA